MTLTEAIIHEEKVVADYDRLKKIRAIDEFEVYCHEYHKQLAEWLTILRDVYAVIDEYDIDFHREQEDLTSMEVDILKALKV